MDISRRKFLVAAALPTLPATDLHAAPNAKDVDGVDPLLRDEIDKIHPLEKIARNIDPQVRICVIDSGALIKKLTQGKAINEVHASTLPSIFEKVGRAAKERVYHCFPEIHSDAKLRATIDATNFLSDGMNGKYESKDGKLFNLLSLGEPSPTIEEHYHGIFLDKTLARKATHASSFHPSQLANIEYHELGHVFDDKATATAVFGTQPVKERFYSRHKTEVRAMTLEAMKIAQTTGNLKQLRAFCDYTMLYSFYGATTGVIDNATQRKGSRSVPYFTHTLYGNIKAAFDASPNKFKGMSDAQLVKLSHSIADASIYTLDQFSAISEALINARMKLLQKPMDTRKLEGNETFLEQNADEPKDRGIPLVNEAIQKGFLNRSLPYVIELRKAEQRILGLQKTVSR